MLKKLMWVGLGQAGPSAPPLYGFSPSLALTADHEKATFRTGYAQPKITGSRDGTSAARLAARGRITTRRDDQGLVVTAGLTT